jgi:hypothetical protein
VIKLGLRFDRRDAPRLREWARRVRNGELGPHENVGTYQLAAEAAETGEPLLIEAQEPMEVVQLAAAYTLMGFRQPVIEELSRG